MFLIFDSQISTVLSWRPGKLLNFYVHNHLIKIREPFEKFVEWRQCAAVMQRGAVTIMPSCIGGGNVVVA
jgi:hypothetical protein